MLIFLLCPFCFFCKLANAVLSRLLLFSYVHPRSFLAAMLLVDPAGLFYLFLSSFFCFIVKLSKTLFILPFIAGPVRPPALTAAREEPAVHAAAAAQPHPSVILPPAALGYECLRDIHLWHRIHLGDGVGKRKNYIICTEQEDTAL